MIQTGKLRSEHIYDAANGQTENDISNNKKKSKEENSQRDEIQENPIEKNQ